MKSQRIQKVISNPLVSLFLLFVPAVCAIINANSFADWLYDPVSNLLSPFLETINTGPSLTAHLFGGNYGLVAMLPFLILYALPTVVIFSLILSFYQSSGIIEQISKALHPYLKVVGIGGHDLVKVVMGFGCNVPAIVSTRSCNDCGRGTCISAISFGAACSYQLPATFAVFAAAKCPEMGLVYLALVAITTLIYIRFTTPQSIRIANTIKSPISTPHLRVPNWKNMIQEVLGELKQFVMTAFPIFIGICFTAATLEWLRILGYFTQILSPVMSLFNLPGEAATAVVLGSVRKDGIAIGLLNQEEGLLSVALESPVQVLTAVYLAGVLLPCIVTLFTIIKEMRWRFALKLCGKQILWASGFSILIAWGGEFLF